MKLKNALILLLTATIWGVAFVAQSAGGDVGTFTFNCIRNILAFIVLMITKKCLNIQFTKEGYKAGIYCGIVLFIAMTLQQYGVMYSTVGKAGFITAFYILLVPVLGILFLKHKVSKSVIIGVILAIIGLYFICINEQFTITKGDLLLLGCSFMFSIHILVIDYFVVKVEPLQMSCIQFLVAGLLSMPGILFEQPEMQSIAANMVPILYAGILSSGVAYTLQIVGQKDMNPTICSLILSLESSISVIAGFLILGSTLTIRELIGCILMFIAIIIAQL